MVLRGGEPARFEIRLEVGHAVTQIEMNRPTALKAQAATNQRFIDEEERWFREDYCATHFPEHSEVSTSSSSSSSPSSSLTAGSAEGFEVQAALSQSSLDVLALEERPVPGNSGEELHWELLLNEFAAIQAERMRTVPSSSLLPSPSSDREVPGQHFDLSLCSDEE